MKQFTDITILLDRSGSMSSCKTAMEQAFNKFIEGHTVNPSTRVTLVQFNSLNDQEVVYQSVPVSAVEKLTLTPRGDTPLLDALCKLIDNTGSRYARLSENERPDQVLTVIITDGEENSSKSYSRRDVRDRITKQRNNYSWEFIYLGANQDAFREAESFGIDLGKTINYNINKLGDTVRSLTTNTVNYASATGLTRGTTTSGAVLDWSADQREDATDVSD